MNIETLSLDELLNLAQGQASEFVKEAADQGSGETTTEVDSTQVSDDSIAADILQKAASFQTETSEDNMNKSQAVLRGEALANQLLEKLASAGDVSSADGVAPGSTPNKVIVDNAAVVGEDNLRDQLQPGLGGTVNEIFDAVVADAASNGVVLDETGNPVAPLEGGAESGVPNQVETYESDEHEKAAAVASLVNEGVDFDQAVNLVKQASEEIEAEAYEMEKIAAVNALVADGYSFEDAVATVKYGDSELTKVATLNSLIEQGVDYDQAVELVKEAAAGRAIRGAISAAKRGFRSGASGAVVGKGGAAHAGGAAVGRGVNAVRQAGSAVSGTAGSMKNYARAGFLTSGANTAAAPGAGALNRAAFGTGRAAGKGVDFAKARPYTTAGIGAGIGAVAAGGTYAATREKRAAFDNLVQIGYDPMVAAELVNQKAYELYGA